MLRIPRKFCSLRNYSKQISSFIDTSPEIEKTLKANGPIVALESTVITHGMSYPQNLETALEIENIVRENNAVPATIGIINGRIKIGLTDHELNTLGNGSTSDNLIKTSRRDFAYVLSKGLNGGTTVSGTIIAAKAVGIDVFATGGIGGVHRDFNETMDVSADLTELGRSSIAVVSSGVKSILDIPKTLEYLETQGVTVATYQMADKEFPAFYTRKSGIHAPYNVNDAIEAAKLIIASKELNLNSGVLIAVPVPHEFAMNADEINAAISEALQKAKDANISGKKATPFLLSAIGQITKNTSLQTNMALLKNNGRVAAEIAVQLSKIKCNGWKKQNESHQTLPMNEPPVVIGSSILDMYCHVPEYPINLNGATYQSTFKKFGGGVGRNIAEGLSKLHGNVEFISKIGNDQDGDFLLKLLPTHCQRSIERDPIHSTATCSVILDATGDPKLHLANMEINNSLDSDLIKKYENIIKWAPIVVFDGNISVDSMGTILDMCRKYNRPAFFEPTDMLIASKPFNLPTDLMKQIKFISPNIFEFNTIAAHFGHEHLIENNGIDVEQQFKNNPQLLESIANISTDITKHIDNIIITLGSFGVLVTRTGSNDDLRFFTEKREYIASKPAEFNPVNRFYPTKKIANAINSSGAGDSFNVGFITAMIRSCREDICVSVGLEAASAAINSLSPVPSKYFDKNHECWQKGTNYQKTDVFENIF